MKFKLMFFFIFAYFTIFNHSGNTILKITEKNRTAYVFHDSYTNKSHVYRAKNVKRRSIITAIKLMMAISKKNGSSRGAY